MAVTLKPVLLDHQWKEDGTNFYRIRITHNRKSRYLKSNVVVYKSDLNKKGEVKTQSVLDSLEDFMRKIRPIVNDIDAADLLSMDIDDVVMTIEKKLKKDEVFRLDFIEYGRKVAMSKKKGGARDGYLSAMNALERHFERHPDISEITVRALRNFEQFLKTEKVVRMDWRKNKVKHTNKQKTPRAVYLYMSCIRHIYWSAKMEFNDPDLGHFPIKTDPFEYYKVPKAPAAKHRDVSVEFIQRLISTRKEYRGSIRLAIDAFLISFGLCGMNAVDMFSCPKPKKGIIHYCRQKTTDRRDDGANMWVKVDPRIKRIMDEYKDSERCFDFYRRYTDIRSFNAALSRAYKRYVEDHKVDAFTFYSARHSWATIGRGKRCNIDKDVISKGLCHVDAGNRVDDIYIKFDWELLWEAQKKILDVFNWE